LQPDGGCYPVGPDQAGLFALPPAGSVSTNKWSVTSQVKKGRDLWFGDAEDNQDYATFTYDCASSTDCLINYNLVFGVFGIVNSVVGDVSVAIQEMSGTTSDPSTFTAKAGYFPLKKDLSQNNVNAICIPIAANTNWYYSAANAGGNQMDAPTYVYWFPMGGASSEETYRMLTESELTELAPPPPPTVDTNQLIERRVATADSFIAQLEHAFDKSLDVEAKAQLSESLRRL
jgi:hypothetical protein